MTDRAATPAARVTGLVGVYDADGTLRGELAYWVGARLGRRHCSLCDITHGSVRARPAWVECRAGLPVPFDTYHRDDQPDDVRAAVGGTVPVVAARTERGVVQLLGPAELEACAGSIDRLMAGIDAAVERLALVWDAV